MWKPHYPPGKCLPALLRLAVAERRLPSPPAPLPLAGEGDDAPWHMAAWFTAQHLAGLPGMPGTERGVRWVAEKNLFACRSKERGKGREYAYDSLPLETRRHIDGLRRAHVVAMQAADAAASALTPGPSPACGRGKAGTAVATRTPRPLIARDPAKLNDLDRARIDAGCILAREMESIMLDSGGSATTAARLLGERLAACACDATLQGAAEALYIKPRGTLYLGGADATIARLQRLYYAFKRGDAEGDVTRYLAPGRPVKKGPDPRLVKVFLRAWQNPMKPPLARVLREITPVLEAQGLSVPSYSALVRLEKALPLTTKMRGRMTGSEFKQLLPYIRRDDSHLHSNDVWVGDGHSFKARVLHPDHGQPFVPEITFILDWVSRKIVGWSVDLAESTLAVSAAFRDAQRKTLARPLIYYSDNGSGQTGKLIDHPVTGTLSRQGIAHHTGIPGNPQARGIIERIWLHTLIALAQSYPTCHWKGADQLTVNRMQKALQKKDFGGIQVPSFGQLLLDIERVVDEYNRHHRHKSLGGKSPEDVYLERMDPTSLVFAAGDAELDALWMPEKLRRVQRGRVRLFNGEYGSDLLAHATTEGETVRVRFDIHDGSRVWIFRENGEPLGEALYSKWNQPAWAPSYREQAQIKRVEGQIALRQKQIDAARATLGTVIDLTPSLVMDVPTLAPDLLPVARDAPEPEPVEMSNHDLMMELYGPNARGEDEDTGEAPDFESAAG